MRPKSAWPLLALVTLLAGCGRCGKTAETADGGSLDAGAVVVTPQLTPGALPATDLRSAVILVFPEFRGANITHGLATYRRLVIWPGDRPLEEVLAPQLKTRGFVEISAADGGTEATLKPFTFRAAREGDRVAMEMSLPFNNDDVGNLLYSNAAIGTEHLATMLPALEGAKDPVESFALELDYVARPPRADFLVNQLANMLEGATWKVQRHEIPDAGMIGPLDAGPRRLERLSDGGIAPDPNARPVIAEARVTLTDETHGGRIEVHRQAGHVVIRYQQPIKSRQR